MFGADIQFAQQIAKVVFGAIRDTADIALDDPVSTAELEDVRSWFATDMSGKEMLKYISREIIRCRRANETVQVPLAFNSTLSVEERHMQATAASGGRSLRKAMHDRFHTRGGRTGRQRPRTMFLPLFVSAF